MSVRARMLLAMAVSTAILLAPAVYAASRLMDLRDIAFEQRGRYAVAFLALGRLQAAIADLDRFARSYVIAPDPGLQANVVRSLENARLHLSQLAQAGYGEAVGGLGARLDSIETATGRIQVLIESGRLEAATTAFQEVSGLLEGLRAPLDDIARAIDRRSLEELVEAQEISATAAGTTRAATAISLVLALAVGLWTTRTITAPLLRLRRATARVATGEFRAPPELPYRRRDEIGDLSRSFRAMTQRLAELERVRTEFVGIVTHDLKAPINVIGGYSDLLREQIYGPTTDRQREVLESVREQIHVLTGMVNQLLDLSRIEAGGLEIEPAETDPVELFESVERAYRGLADREGIDFAVEVEPTVPPVVFVDATRLRDQVLGNLLSNAFKFTPEGGRIRVRAAGRRDRLHIEVSDTGPGLPADQIPHIFDKYYQVTPEARAKGAGLGLAIVKEVVDAHGGRIGVQSAPGVGTTFFIVLPTPSLPARRQRPSDAAA
ncbi:MAG TPA: HAMP domain-containing sensor histidine kinase [Longimicrobiales bacterium]